MKTGLYTQGPTLNTWRTWSSPTCSRQTSPAGTIHHIYTYFTRYYIKKNSIFSFVLRSEIITCVQKHTSEQLLPNQLDIWFWQGTGVIILWARLWRRPKNLLFLKGIVLLIPFPWYMAYSYVHNNDNNVYKVYTFLYWKYVHKSGRNSDHGDKKKQEILTVREGGS